MKHLLVRLAVVVLLVATVFGVAPHASAQDGTPSALFANIHWVIECSSAWGGGFAEMNYGIALHPGYRFETTYGGYGLGSYQSYSESWIADNAFDYISYWSVMVAIDGYYTRTINIYAPNGVLVSSTMYRADCTTGEVWTSYGDVYGINEPVASARVLGTVLADTPVYAEANPTTALVPVLKAGQTWFIVGQVTGTDGELWYKVFVGGAQMAWVPAAVMAPQGPVPGA